jgi:DNA mismatch endonuclease (patch repair protein)
MVDVLTSQQRTFNMSRIKSKNTGPEKKIRWFLLSKKVSGYKLHFDLPGKPDFAFPKNRLAVFIDGCFWHKCPQCFKSPATRIKFWGDKIDTNIQRDKKVNKELRKLGWKVLRIWEHEVKNKPDKAVSRIIKKLENVTKEEKQKYESLGCM